MPKLPLPSVVSALALAAAVTMPSAPARADGDGAAGATVFKICLGCHSATPGTQGISAPSLFGVVGRKAGTAEGYDYSPALRASGVTWTAETLAVYLAGPVRFIPGARKTTYKPPSAEDRANVIAFLHTLK